MQPPCISSHQSLMSKWTLGLSCRCRLVTECIDLSRDCPFLSKLVKPFSPSMRSQFPPSLKVEELFLAVPVCMKHPNQKFSHALSIVATTPSTTAKTTIRCLKGRTGRGECLSPPMFVSPNNLSRWLASAWVLERQPFPLTVFV